MIYIFWAAANIEEAKPIIKKLLNEKLIVCASVIPKVLSFYYWEGEFCEDVEVKVILKSKKSFFDDILERISEESSYDVPEVSMLEVKDANPEYLKWLDETLKES